MINYIVDNGQIVAFTGILTAFFLTCICMGSFSKYLPKDMGRQYAHDGKLSAGKPRGAGFIFVLVFIASGIVFGPFTREYYIYYFTGGGNDDRVFGRLCKNAVGGI